MEPGSQLTWTWDFCVVSDMVRVLKAEQDRRLVWEWHDSSPQTVEMSFEARDGGTFVQVTESPAEGSGDEQVAAALASTGGFTLVLCAAKVLVEHNVTPTIVRDRYPDGH